MSALDIKNDVLYAWRARNGEPEAPQATPTLPWTITVDETAKVLGISTASTREAIRRGEIPHLKIGRRILVPRKQLEAMLERAGCNA